MAPGQDTTTRDSVLCSAASAAGCPNSSSSSSAALAPSHHSPFAPASLHSRLALFQLFLSAAARARHALRRLTGSLPPPHFCCVSLRLSSVVQPLRTSLQHTHNTPQALPSSFFFFFFFSLLHFSTARFYTITQTHAHIEDIRTKISALCTTLESYFVYIYSLLPLFLSRKAVCQSHVI